MIDGYLVRTKQKDLLKKCIKDALDFLVKEVQDYNYLDLKMRIENESR